MVVGGRGRTGDERVRRTRGGGVMFIYWSTAELYK